MISVAALHSGPASAKQKSDDLDLGEENYLQDRDSLYYLSHGFHGLIEQSIRVTHFFTRRFIDNRNFPRIGQILVGA